MGTESRETSPGSMGHVQAAHAPSSWRAMEYEQANYLEAPFNPASQSVVGRNLRPCISHHLPDDTRATHLPSRVDFYLKPVSETGGKPGRLT